jgi:hypothetical protein
VRIWPGPAPPGSAFFTKSVHRRAHSARSLDERAPNIFGMDVVAIVLALLSFAVLIALLYGIDRI